MKKTKKKIEDVTKQPKTPPLTATQTPVPETDQERQARVDRANQAIRDILVKENCILMVPTLDISSGRVVPQIQVVAKQLK